jgi:ABC-type multidrug transport system fused ATPase/permease subunit
MNRTKPPRARVFAAAGRFLYNESRSPISEPNQMPGFKPSQSFGGLPAVGHIGKSRGASRSQQTASPKLVWKLLPDVWELMKPRRGILFLGLILMVINRLLGLVLPYSMKPFVDHVILKHQAELLTPLVAAVVIATVLQGSTSYSLTQLLSKSAQRLITELRVKVQAHVGRLPVAYYDANKTGVLVSRIMSDVEGVRNLIGTGLINFLGGILTAVFVLVLLLRISVVLTGTAVAALLIFGFGLSQGLKRIRPLFRARPRLNAEVTGRLTESLGGVRVVKGYHAEEREERIFQRGVQRLLENVLDTLTATSLMGAGATAVLGVITAVMLFLGAHLIPSAKITLGDLTEFLALLAMLVSPVAQIATIGPQMTEAFAGLERTREVLNEKPEDQSPARTISLDRIEGRVQFERVHFAYEIGKPVLHDVEFEAEPGTATAFVGPSGGGKSTIIGLIAGFYQPTEGRVLVDDVDIAKVRLGSYRSQLGVVLQDTFLFDGTIRENVAFSRPDASEEDVLAACRTARVDEFAEQFEEKYDTVIGERGVKLSGGQKQRVSIARAILADPRILILDEATSSLDSESEALIQEGLRYLMRGRTTFVIAHRLSTIRRADQILVIAAGRIVERGTHESLYAARGRYFELYTRQHGVETNLFLAPGEGDSVPEGDPSGMGEGVRPEPGESILPEAIRFAQRRRT